MLAESLMVSVGLYLETDCDRLGLVSLGLSVDRPVICCDRLGLLVSLRLLVDRPVICCDRPLG